MSPKFSLPQDIRDNYEIHEWRHACAVLQQDFPREYQDIIDILRGFELRASEIVQPGGGKSSISSRLDKQFYQRGWVHKDFSTQIVVDGHSIDSPTHSVDCFRNCVAVEVEWNNKDPFFDRDLNNFRLLFELRAVSVGIIITRSSELQGVFNKLGKGSSYGASTTHMGKLLPRIEGGGGGGCPVLVFGITRALYREDL
ncbi:MAG: BglII/BstYI family type II restriction endonuclease [Armatimonadota bacterium]|jgi:hypothetical protein